MHLKNTSGVFSGRIKLLANYIDSAMTSIYFPQLIALRKKSNLKESIMNDIISDPITTQSAITTTGSQPTKRVAKNGSKPAKVLPTGSELAAAFQAMPQTPPTVNSVAGLLREHLPAIVNAKSRGYTNQGIADWLRSSGIKSVTARHIGDALRAHDNANNQQPRDANAHAQEGEQPAELASAL